MTHPNTPGFSPLSELGDIQTADVSALFQEADETFNQEQRDRIGSGHPNLSTPSVSAPEGLRRTPHSLEFLRP